MSSFNSSEPINRLLASFPLDIYKRLYTHLESVDLPQHKTIYGAGEDYKYAYFPCCAMISTVAIMENGSTTEIGVIGNEGMVGLPIILGTSYTNSTAIVQVGGDGLRIASERLRKELILSTELKTLLMRYVQARIIQLGQTAACNRHHNLEQRFARWLLMVRDSLQKDEFQLTQEFISQMLGVRRTVVTEIAGRFQKENIIYYKRGFIRIISPEKLEKIVCECYGLVTKEFSRLLDSPII
ncbi:MAG: Crp/Fnr family transcriptional regulator [Cyanobacteria bacterium P01_F01_bin.143]